MSYLICDAGAVNDICTMRWDKATKPFTRNRELEKLDVLVLAFGHMRIVLTEELAERIFKPEMLPQKEVPR